MISAPWSLRGRGLVALYRARAELVPPDVRATFRGGVAAVLLLSYERSPVGPYHELLYIGGFFDVGGALHPRVTRILVDSPASLEAGRDLWGLPKALARFDWHDKFVRVERAGHLVAEFAWHPFGPRLPALSAPIPRGWRTLVQPWSGETRFTSPQAVGHLRLARLTHALVNPALFPDVGERPLLTLEISDVRLLFPKAKIGHEKSGHSGR